MFNRRSIRVLCAAGVLCVAFAGSLTAQQKPAAPPAPAPSPATLLMAKEIIDLKGAATMFDPLVTRRDRASQEHAAADQSELTKDIDLVADNC